MVVDAEAGWTPDDADIFQQMFGGSSGGPGLSSDWGSDGEGAAGSSGRGGAPALLVLNKTDLAAKQRQQQNGSGGGAAAGDGPAAAAAAAGVPGAAARHFAAVVQTSAATLEGMEALRAAVLQLAGAPQVGGGWGKGGGRETGGRHAEALCHGLLMAGPDVSCIPATSLPPAAGSGRRGLGGE